ncbi:MULTISPECIES: DUF2637 domain-containing protein [unclassified Streptomyces]|uniref:DUF2637 domain-containing protein n=1 Tax=unclassified Streptomyces TaxID=2593676 RepID=UPI0011628178|nr:MULTISPECIES: DUF2637 domain-containing protein [unclassified Streptomyces]NMI60986.1 DUF2637 domain-containing protein [Streptomyces sp. RLA2-12]QDN60077.1 DUF2637 domain-containing protein [Streptomyces sp. S1D4-20]QDN70157.1 DUF2637 domain-containing protein [Streptomyces sp. S1D4-14]QDO52610.1 DUF2637 domain-containing protein [Streptomyces sp. RLB3-5]QDO62853.1 DUF2637 domain-containing protein [Streptomyces sp. RLB1-8]
MTTTTQTTERPTVPPLTTPELWLLGAVAVLAAGVGGLGLASSFEAVSAAGARWGFASPWMLPVGIDTAIPVFTAAFLLLIRTDMPLGWVRFVPWTLTGVTCWLNIAAGHSLSAKLAHGTMPLLWVVLSEVAAHVYASRIGAVTGRRMEKIRRSRWLLAPLSTFALWRRMTLWEVTSYTDALGRERERQLARAQLRQQHGRRWRSKTPRPERVLLKLGELAPAGDDIPPVPPQDPKPPKQDAPKPPRKRTTKAKTTKARTPAELLTEARTATAEWTDDAINAEAIRTTLHCSAANSRVLRDLLLSERADGRRLHPIDATDESGQEKAA